jgi:AcrR family transcriptional regulator
VTAKVLRWERRPDERPTELLEAALRIFAERGYANTRLEDIAAAAGVTKGTIYHYFDTKEELLLRAIEHNHERAFGPLERVLEERHGPVASTIRLFLRRAFGRLDSARLTVLTLLVQGVAREVPAAYQRWLELGPVRGWQILADLIEEGKGTGEFRRDVDSEVAARITLSGLILQFIWQQSTERVPGLAIDADRLIDSAADVLLNSLQPPTSSARRARPSRRRRA